MRKSKGKTSKLLPHSFRIISSCIKTVSTNASTVVRSAGASVAASISSADDCREQVEIAYCFLKKKAITALVSYPFHYGPHFATIAYRHGVPALVVMELILCADQVLWSGFDKLELGPTAFRRVLLLGYLKGFQVFDVEDASSLSELVSRRDGPVSFLQVLPAPANCEGAEKYKSSHPILVVVGGDKDEALQNAGQGPARYGSAESSFGSSFDPPTTVRFYSMKSNEYVKVIDFKSAVLMVRCSPRVVAIGLEEQVSIYCYEFIDIRSFNFR
ncbi:hypothetical protein RD792_009387 [Penstemon davidsonii]|uniref:BCAS3 WD40 domain-containing protein n=1 Tax=Penstemon davidsonii TaxID=160366 RepID=A0ABR0CZ59_9LAMI|nr:hypothetical protein RD792_009387 [Penstemon davidsonii]